MKFLLQTEITKHFKPDESLAYFQFSADEPNWQDTLKKLDEDEHLYIPFVSIQIARHIEIKHKKLSSGLVWPHDSVMYHYRNPLYVNRWKTYLDDSCLNQEGYMTTLYDLYRNAPIYDRMFIRPLSPWKPFTGFDCTKDDLKFEISSIFQLTLVKGDEIVYVHPYKELDKYEYRCYYIDEELVTCSPYGWEKVDYSAPIPMEVLDAASIAGKKLEVIGDAFVIDIGIHNGEAKVIEVNAVPTSGWYGGMDANKLLRKIKGLFE